MAEFPVNLAKSLFAIQGELRGVVKDATNPHFKNRYASLEGVIDTIRPAMQKHGVVFLQAPGDYSDGTLRVTTSLIHAETGECIHSTVGLPLSKCDPQGVGSATTYACRYSLMSMLGLPPVDDDAQATTQTKDEIEWGGPAATKVYRMLLWIIQQHVTQASDVFEFREKNKGMIGNLPVKMRQNLDKELDRIGGAAAEAAE
jgi:hypothetical protein